MYDGGAKNVGHLGWGGSHGFADPEAGVAFGCAMNVAREPQSEGIRAIDLMQALYSVGQQ